MLAPPRRSRRRSTLRCGTLAPSAIWAFFVSTKPPILPSAPSSRAGPQVGERPDRWRPGRSRRAAPGCARRWRRRRPRRPSRVVSGPMTQSAPIVVAPWIWVPGGMTVSGPIVTSASIHVVAGSMTIAPSRMSRLDGAAVELGAEPSELHRSLTPSVCQTSSTRWARTVSPRPWAMPMTSVRYFSPCALSVPTSARAWRSSAAVEGIDPAVDLGGSSAARRWRPSARRWPRRCRRRHAAPGRSRSGRAAWP